MKVRHEKWGEIVITDEVRLHTIVSFFDRIQINPSEAKNQEQVFTGSNVLEWTETYFCSR